MSFHLVHRVQQKRDRERERERETGRKVEVVVVVERKVERGQVLNPTPDLAYKTKPIKCLLQFIYFPTKFFYKM